MPSQADVERAIANGEVDSESDFRLHEIRGESANAEAFFKGVEDKERQLERKRQEVEREREKRIEAWENHRGLIQRRDRIRSQLENAKQSLEHFETAYNNAPEPHLDNRLGFGAGPVAFNDIYRIGADVAAWGEAIRVLKLFVERKEGELKDAQAAVEQSGKKHGLPSELNPQPEPEVESEDQDDGEDDEEGEEKAEEFVSEPAS